MKERPILFSAPMVRAVLDGSKTQTRRVVKGLRITGPNNPPDNQMFDAYKGDEWVGAFSAATGRGNVTCPYGVPGDRLWVRETWRTQARHDYLKPTAIPAES